MLALAEGGALLAGCQSCIATDYIRAQKIVASQILMCFVCLNNFETRLALISVRIEGILSDNLITEIGSAW